MLKDGEAVVGGAHSVRGFAIPSGARAGIEIATPFDKIGSMFFTFKIEFEASNNIAEYEALVLGLSTTCDIYICGDSQLVINQVNGSNTINHHLLVHYFSSLPCHS